MRILYCRVGQMIAYDGSVNDPISGGGSYNHQHIGHEVNNFTNCNGTYYGFVQARNGTIDITGHFQIDSNAESVENVLAIWVASNQIVGYYKNATVFRRVQSVPEEVMNLRLYADYNIKSNYAVCIPPDKRIELLKGKMGRANIWYGEESINQIVLNYISAYESELTKKIEYNQLTGQEKDALVKVRVNQSVFREKLLQKYGEKCSLCGMSCTDLLIASHIKPWSKSDASEKTSVHNGLLLCPNHDKLFDSGYISFDENGKILISEHISAQNYQLLGVNHEMSINVSEEMQPFLRYHRKYIYGKNAHK